MSGSHSNELYILSCSTVIVDMLGTAFGSYSDMIYDILAQGCWNV